MKIPSFETRGSLYQRFTWNWNCFVHFLTQPINGSPPLPIQIVATPHSGIPQLVGVARASVLRLPYLVPCSSAWLQVIVVKGINKTKHCLRPAATGLAL
jgi:hypothetical protein